MTDITRLITSLKRRSAHAKEFGDSITFVKLEDLDALVEALEKAQQDHRLHAARLISEKALLKERIGELEGQLRAAENNEIDARCRIAELEESHAQVIQSRDHYKRMLEESLKKLAESLTVTVKLPDIMPPEAAPAHYWGSGESMAYADGYNKSAADLKTSFALSCSSASVNVEFE